MRDILINSQILRNSLTENYHIDHIIDLKLISAVLLENDIGDPYDEFQMEAAAKFAKYFNKRWNLQIIPNCQNEDKSDAVIEYIRWKYENYAETPDDNVFEIIDFIFEFYQDNRDDILEDINTDEIGHRNKFRDVEYSLYLLLKCRHCRHPITKFDDIMEESQMLHESISRSYNMDHKVELQIVAAVLTMNNIKNIDLAIKFASYFNEDWNLQIVKKKKNTSKGKNVHKWLQYKHQEIDYYPNESRGIMNFIFNQYKFNRENVIEDISQDLSLREGQKRLFFKMEQDLYDLLSS